MWFRVLRSAGALCTIRGLVSELSDYEKAYGYLHRHAAWMDCSRYHRLRTPIGSGVTEAACKIKFTQRFKRAAMKAVACYVRVSTIGQNEAGQNREINRWLWGNGIAPVRWYIDKSTGNNLACLAFQELQQTVFMGKSVQLSSGILTGLAGLSAME